MATAWEEIVRFLLCGSFIHPIFLFGFCSDSYEVQVSALIHIFDSTSRRCSHCISGHRHLRSADRGHLNFPHVKLASYGGRSFAKIGTHFLLTLETIVFLFHLLSATSKPFSSLSTRLAHAARLVFLNKTCYINSLLLLLLLLLITLCIIFAVSV